MNFEINKELKKNELIISIKGELNTTTAPKLEEVIKSSLRGVKVLIFDLKDLEYISSAGLRVLLVSKKSIDKQQGQMLVRNVNATVMDIFDMTGFTDILDID